MPNPVRMHWTGCPNSCGQAQVADIGLMGGPAKHEGKAVEGARIFTGGKIGEGAVLASEFEKGVPVQVRTPQLLCCSACVCGMGVLVTCCLGLSVVAVVSRGVLARAAVPSNTLLVNSASGRALSVRFAAVPCAKPDVSTMLCRRMC